MINLKKNDLKGSKGITLIALVVTIIVLLILAGVTISMVLGNNGIMQRTADAKQITDDAQIKERIRLAYNSALMKDITNKKDEVQKSTLEEELENEFPGKTISVEENTDQKAWIITVDQVVENVPIEGALDDEGDIDKLRKFFIEKTPDDWLNHDDGTYNDPEIIRVYNSYIHFPEYAIYNNNYYMIMLDEETAAGKDVQLLKDDNATEINEGYKPFIDFKVKGYEPSAGGSWRLFYSDSENVYLISDSIGQKVVKNEYESASETGEISELGKKLNKEYTNKSSWTLKSDGANINNNIKAVSWLTRENNWNTYKMNGVANWAIGGPTLEMWAKVYETVCNSDDRIIPNVEENAVGYSNNINSGLVVGYPILYGPSTDSYYCLASPASLSDTSIYKVGETRMAGGALEPISESDTVYIRPFVSVPVSKVKDGTISFYFDR